jgi:polysaccharide export outer membrane protein
MARFREMVMTSRVARGVCAALVFAPLSAGAQTPAARHTPPAALSAADGAAVPRDYVIGTEDVLEVKFWKDVNLSREVVVRPDGKIGLELLNEVQAAGLTPDELRQALLVEAKRFMEEPNVAVIVKQINSRKVFITGQVERPGSYPLASSMTVLQLISLAGGLKEFAKEKEIVVMRTDKAAPTAYPFNYEDILKGRNLAQNIVLKPGDTVVVP